MNNHAGLAIRLPPDHLGQQREIVRLFDPSGYVLRINQEDGSPAVTIRSASDLEFHPGYDPDDAARRFWEAMALHSPSWRPAGELGATLP